MTVRDFYKIEMYESVNSTNDIVIQRARQGEREGLCVVAKSQSAGQGRLGRVFHSPAGSGIYFSVLLRPSIIPRDCLFITTAAAVAVQSSIEKTFGINTGIKWVNDIYLREKKVCGILTKASQSAEKSTPDYVILGIGINLYKPERGFPSDISSIAGALFESKREMPKNAYENLLSDILNTFYEIYTVFDKNEIARRYREKSCTVGKKITVVCGNDRREAMALDIDGECHLLVEYEDNSERAALSSGEISIRQNIE